MGTMDRDRHPADLPGRAALLGGDGPSAAGGPQTSAGVALLVGPTPAEPPSPCPLPPLMGETAAAGGPDLPGRETPSVAAGEPATSGSAS